MTGFFSNVYDWVFVLQLIAVSFSAVYTLGSYERSLKGLGKMVLYTGVLYAAETLLNWGLFSLAQYATFLQGLNFPLAHLVSIALFAVFFSRYRLTARLITASTVFIVAVSVLELGTGIMRYLSMLSLPELFSVAADVLVVLASLFVRRFGLSSFSDIPKIGAVTILICAAVDVLLLLVQMRHAVGVFVISDDTGLYAALQEISMILDAAIAISFFLMYLTVYQICRKQAEVLEAEMENYQLKANEQMMGITETAIEEMHEIRHDIGNQLSVLSMLVREKRYGELETYLEGFSAEINGQIRFVRSGNSVLDSILNTEILKADAKNVRIDARIKVPENLQIDGRDLGRILCNLIDNAMEECERTDADPKTVDVRVFIRTEYLYICVKNPMRETTETGRRGGDYLVETTSKENNGAHGYGHKIVKRLVTKYNGSISYSAGDGVFTADAMLEMKDVGAGDV